MFEIVRCTLVVIQPERRTAYSKQIRNPKVKKIKIVAVVVIVMTMAAAMTMYNLIIWFCRVFIHSSLPSSATHSP